MKRTRRATASTPGGKTRVIEPGRLTSVRGGQGLGVAIHVLDVLIPGMQLQHNEALICR